MAAIAFQAGQQGGLLAADISPCSGVRMDIHIKAGAENILTQNAGVASLSQRDIHYVYQVIVLAAKIDISGGCAKASNRR